MTYSDVLQRLQALQAGEPVVFDNVLAGEAGLLTLIANCLGATDFEITPAEGSDLSTGAFSGTAALLGIGSNEGDDPASLRVTFAPGDSDAVELHVEVALPGDWHFSQSFPNLPPYFSFNTPDFGYKPTYLDLLSFANPLMVFTTSDYTDTLHGLDHARGLNFAGYVELTGLLEPLQDVVSSTNPPLVSGNLTPGVVPVDYQPPPDPDADVTVDEPAADQPADSTEASEAGEAQDPGAFCLAASIPFEIGGDVFTFKSARLMLCSSLTAGAGPGASSIEIAVVFTLAGVDVDLYTSFEIGKPIDFLQIGAYFQNFTLPGLGDLVSVAGDDLGGTLPESLGDLGSMEITAFGLGVGIRPASLESVRIALRAATTWVIVPDIIQIDSLNVMWSIAQPLKPARAVSAAIYGAITFGSNPGTTLIITAEYPAFIITAALAPGSTIPIGAMINHFAPNTEIPDDTLVISQLNLLASPANKTYHIDAQIDNLWTITLFEGAGAITMDRLFLSLDYQQAAVGILIAGDLTLKVNNVGFLLSASAERAPAVRGQGSWNLAATFAPLEGQDGIPLAQLVADFAAGAMGVDSIDLPPAIANFALTQLDFTYATDLTRRFTFKGGVDWPMDFGDFGTFTFRALLDIESYFTPPPNATTVVGLQRTTKGKIGVQIDFSETFGIDFFDNLTVTAYVAFVKIPAAAQQPALPPAPGQSPTQQTGSLDVLFSVRKGEAELLASFSKGAGVTTFTLDFNNVTLGDMLGFLVSLFDPDIEDFRLDPPWDLLNAIDLSGLKLKIIMATDRAQSQVSVEYVFSNDAGKLAFINIKRIALTYGRKTPSGAILPKPTVFIDITADFFGQTNKSMAWDAINDQPPATPGAGSAIFDLDYLGIGQHITFRNPSGLTTIDKVMSELIKGVTGDANVLMFSKDSGWLIGARFTVIGTVGLTVIFNDPVMYGLLITLAGEKAAKFAGLRFEILYRRVTDTIGVYHTELTLPDAMRQLEFGAVSVTLPIVTLDIYTNGDFRIDVGFPKNGDWSRSISVDAFPFTGAGGFYFAKLSAATATSVPRIINGNFNPVIEFGLALRVGLGKTFVKGPLKAEISVTVQGIFEGVVAWFNPNDPNVQKATYFWLQATVQIVGRLYGEVDFEVIAVSVEVLVYAGVRLTVESYQPILIMLVAGVSVKAKVKIVFVTIHFSFSLTIRESFTIGSAQRTPWVLDPSASALPRAGGGGPNYTEEEQAAIDAINNAPAKSSSQLYWGSFRVWQGTDAKAIDLFFQPAFTEGLSSDTGLVPAEGSPAPAVSADVKGVALLFVENAIPVDAASHADYTPDPDADSDTLDFNRLVEAMFAWAVRAYYTDAGSIPDIEEGDDEADFSYYLQFKNVALDDLRALLTMLEPATDTSESSLFTFDQLVTFLKANFAFTLTDRREEASATIFPMFPQLKLTTTDIATAIEFADFNRVDSQDLYALREFFRDLKAGGLIEMETPPPDNDDDDGTGTESMAAVIFRDYFKLLMRSVVQAAIEYMEDNKLDAATPAALLNQLGANGRLNHVAGMASRFMLHGLRLPFQMEAAGDTYDLVYTDQVTTPLYVLTGQQFTLSADSLAKIRDDSNTTFVYTLTLESADATQTDGWVAFNDVDVTPKAGDPPETKVEYRIGPNHNLHKLIEDLDTMAFTPDVKTGRTGMLPPYQIAPRKFVLQHQIPLSGAASGVIYALPDSLRDELRAASDTLSLRVSAGKPDAVSGELRAETVSGVTWAARVEFQVRQVPNLDGTGVMPDVYQIAGLSEAGQETLRLLWNAISDSGVTLTLLYPQSAAQENPSGLIAGANASGLIVRTNLSGAETAVTTVQVTGGGRGSPAARIETTNPLYGAALAQPSAFMQLLWASGHTESAGFYLRYTRDGGSLPDYLFATGQTATLSLLVTGFAANSLTQKAVNAAVITGSIDEGATVYAESPALTEKRLAVPVGFVGFRVVTDLPDASRTLENLFQMLGYEIVENDSFKGSLGGLPLGPLVDTKGTDAASDDEWVYEKAIPYFRFVQSVPEGVSADNPYLGVGAALEVEVEFQDVYGNRTVAKADDDGDAIKDPNPVDPFSLDVRYTDNIVGLNEWPLLIETYLFDQQGGAPLLDVNLRLELNGIVVGPGVSIDEAARKIGAARLAYQTIVYQLEQDVRFTLTTSVSPALRAALDKTSFQNFAADAYKTLATLEALQPFTYTPKSGDTLQSVGAGFTVGADALADVNQNVPGLFATTTPLKVRQSALPQFGDTLMSLLARVNEGPSADITLNDLATNNASAPLNPRVTLTIPGKTDANGQPLTVLTAAGDTLGSAAAAQGVTVAALANANRTVPNVFGADAVLFIRYHDDNAEAGETLDALVERLNAENEAARLTVTQFAQDNANVPLTPGRTLVIPGQVDTENAPLKYQTAAGDSLNSVAAAQGVLTADLADANKTVTNLFAADVTVRGETITPRGGDSLASILERANADVSQSKLTLAQFALDNGAAALGSAPLTIPYLYTLGTVDAAAVSASGGLSALATDGIALDDLARVNQNLRGLLKSGVSVTVSGNTQTISAGDTLRTLAARLGVTVVALAEALPASALASGAKAILPPRRVQIAVTDDTWTLPDDLIFAVTAQIEMRRESGKIQRSDTNTLLDAPPAVESITAFLAPFTEPGEDDVTTLLTFAQKFEGAFGGLKLAVGKDDLPGSAQADDANPAATQPLWAVDFNAIRYDVIHDTPLFFAPAPLANTLLMGDVRLQTVGEGGALVEGDTSKTFHAVDLDTWGRALLEAIDEFLEPATAVPAFQAAQASVESLLASKQMLADAIVIQMTNVLDAGSITQDQWARRLAAAQAALKRELLAHLASAYSIETVVQFDGELELSRQADTYTAANAPRLVGKPVVAGSQAGAQVNYTLSAAQVPVAPGEALLTFLYNTQAPAADRSADLNLTFSVNEVEYNAGAGSSIGDYQSPSWLTFITGGKAFDIGAVSIPIPLRAYPVPPSLILQRADADPDSQQRLQQIREWQFEYVYEHLDAAQDIIETTVAYNEAPIIDTSSESAAQGALFAALANFTNLYSTLAGDLALWAAVDPTDTEAIKTPAAALAAFAALARAAAEGWRDWTFTPVVISDTDHHYQIEELNYGENPARVRVTALVNGTTPAFPLIELNESDDHPAAPPPGTTVYIYQFDTGTPNSAPNLGSAALPDRTVIIPNRDIIRDQSAWSAVWLARNRKLVEGVATNPAFIYETPRVRFSNPVTPLLVNDVDWDIASLSAVGAGTPQPGTLEEHLDRLFATLLPATADRAFDLRLDCRYAFALRGSLLTSIPVLLGPRLSLGEGADIQADLKPFRDNLAESIRRWKQASRPEENGGMYLFSLSILSSLQAAASSGNREAQNENVNLPLLHINDLRLRLADVTG